MKRRPLARLIRAACTVLTFIALAAPPHALADDLIVEHDPAEGNFATIQAAIEHAAALLRSPSETRNFRIIVRASDDPYPGPIIPIDKVPIIGESTSGTTIGGSATLIEIRDNVSSLEIRNFTFRNATIAISIANGSGIDITNNVFHLGSGGTAIQVQNSTGSRIVNNTFYNNGTAISTNSNIEISNNIFANNQLAILDLVPLTLLSYNDYFANASNGVDLDPDSIPNIREPASDPLFVDAAGGNFQLEEDSPAKGTGNPKYRNSFDNSFDMGAFGGPNSGVPFSGVTGLTAEVGPADRITLRWNRSTNPAVSGYRVYYGTSPREYDGDQAAEGRSPITITGAATTTANLSGLPTAPPPPPAVPSLRVTPLDRALKLDWDRVEGASGYIIYWSTADFGPDSLPQNPQNVIRISDRNRTSHTITGLVNGTPDSPYFVAIRAVAQTTFFVAVTAVIDLSRPGSPGSANESNYSSEVSPVIGDEVAGELSPRISEFPEAISPHPNLSGEGCFIATAAYGFYSAPQVQLLRDFRDRYLMTNSPGRAFVAWYYRVGPRAAHFLNSHPWLKPPVRFALLPLVTCAYLMIKAPLPVQGGVVILAALCCSLACRRMRRSRDRAGSPRTQHEGGRP